MLYCDYKFWYIKREDNIHISECAIRFYEGDITTEDEFNTDKRKIEPVTKYRRTKRLLKSELEHLKDYNVKTESNGNEAVVFTSKDFGVITTDDELRLFLNEKLAKDKDREPIEEQK